MKKILIIYILFFYSMCILYAAPKTGEIPLDGGSWILLAAGVGYATKKIADKRKKNKQ